MMFPFFSCKGPLQQLFMNDDTVGTTSFQSLWYMDSCRNVQWQDPNLGVDIIMAAHINQTMTHDGTVTPTHFWHLHGVANDLQPYAYCPVTYGNLEEVIKGIKNLINVFIAALVVEVFADIFYFNTTRFELAGSSPYLKLWGQRALFIISLPAWILQFTGLILISQTITTYLDIANKGVCPSQLMAILNAYQCNSCGNLRVWSNSLPLYAFFLSTANQARQSVQLIYAEYRNCCKKKGGEGQAKVNPVIDQQHVIGEVNH